MGRTGGSKSTSLRPVPDAAWQNGGSRGRALRQLLTRHCYVEAQLIDGPTTLDQTLCVSSARALFLSRRRPPRRVTSGPGALTGVICGLALAAAAFVSGSGATSPTLKAVAGNLNNPRKIFIDAGGSVYVVEAGTGGNVGGHRCRVSCVGSSGAVVRIAGGHVQRYITDLGSFAVPTGQSAQGPVAFQIVHGTDYVLMQDMELTAKGVNRVGLPDAGTSSRRSPGAPRRPSSRTSPLTRRRTTRIAVWAPARNTVSGRSTATRTTLSPTAAASPSSTQQRTTCSG